MIENKTALELGGIAGRGGSLEVDGARFTALELGGIAMRLKAGAHLKVFHADRFTALDLGGIAGRAPEGATVIFT